MSSGVREISVGNAFVCAVTEAGGVKCWGLEGSGELGNGVADVNGHRNVPTDVTGLTSGVRSVAVGGDNACAVTVSGAVKCWGDGLTGVLGSSNTAPDSAVPVDVAGLSSGVVSVSVGQAFACALTRAGAVKCWGGVTQKPVGGTVPPPNPTPVPVAGLASGVRSVSVQGRNACAVTASHGVVCWGMNGQGQLGDGNGYATEPVRDVPKPVKRLTSGQAVVSVGSDGDYGSTCSVSTAGAVKCWGYYPLLGNGSQDNSSVPVQVSGLSSGATAVSVGLGTACAVTTAGRVTCWGQPLGSGSGSSKPVALPWFGTPATTKPAKQGPAKTAPKSRAATTTSIVGTWRGTVRQAGSAPFTVKIRIFAPLGDKTDIEQVVGSCTGGLTYAIRKGSEYAFAFQAASPRCANGTVILTMLSPTRVRYRWKGNGSTASGILTRLR